MPFIVTDVVDHPLSISLVHWRCRSLNVDFLLNLISFSLNSLMLMLHVIDSVHFRHQWLSMTITSQWAFFVCILRKWYWKIFLYVIEWSLLWSGVLRLLSNVFELNWQNWGTFDSEIAFNKHKLIYGVSCLVEYPRVDTTIWVTLWGIPWNRPLNLSLIKCNI